MPSSVPPFSAQGLSVPSTATWRANVDKLDVANRAPKGSDWAGYAVGDLWRAPAGWYQLKRAGSATTLPLWAQLASGGELPGDVVTAAAVYGTRQLVSSYTGALFDITRLSDLTVLSVAQLGRSGKPNVSAIAAFLSGTVGFFTKVYDQTGNGYHATQTVLACAPVVDLIDIQNGCPWLTFCNSYRVYQSGLGTFGVTSYSGTVLTITGGVPSWVAPGQAVAATNIPYYTAAITATAVSGQTITVASVPSGVSVGMAIGWSTASLSVDAFGALPAGATISGISGNVITVSGATPPALTTNGVTLTLCVRNLITAVTATTITIQVAPTGTPGAVTIGVPSVWLNLPTGLSVPWQSSGFAFVARPGGNDIPSSWLWLGQPATSQDSGKTTGALSGYGLYKIGTTTLDCLRVVVGNGATGNNYTQQHSVPAAADFFAVTQSGTTNSWWGGRYSGSATQGGTSAVSLLGGSWGYSNMYGPQTRSGDVEFAGLIVYGAAPTAAQMTSVQIAFYDAFGIKPQGRVNVGLWGSSTTNGQGNYSSRATAMKLLRSLEDTAPLIARNCGDSNTIEIGNTDDYILNGYDANAPLNVCVYHPGLGNSIQAPDTGAAAWNAVVAGIAALRTIGFGKIVLIGSASRGTFTSGQLTEFRNAKAMMNGLALSYADAYVDLETDPVFGADTAMTVTAVSGNTVTVSALSTYAVAGNYVQWSGMPWSIASDTGAVSISSISGLVLTLSAAATGVAVGSTIGAINPAPWTTPGAAYWNTDNQHFHDAGYQAINELTLNAMLASLILP
jgi:hypothetical protein